jgi:hypothetical protein
MIPRSQTAPLEQLDNNSQLDNFALAKPEMKRSSTTYVSPPTRQLLQATKQFNEILAKATDSAVRSTIQASLHTLGELTTGLHDLSLNDQIKDQEIEYLKNQLHLKTTENWVNQSKYVDVISQFRDVLSQQVLTIANYQKQLESNKRTMQSMRNEIALQTSIAQREPKFLLSIANLSLANESLARKNKELRSQLDRAQSGSSNDTSTVEPRRGSPLTNFSLLSSTMLTISDVTDNPKIESSRQSSTNS